MSPSAILFRNDDAVGNAILRHLRKDIPLGVTVLEETGDGAELFEVWKGAGAVILVDAVQSGALLPAPFTVLMRPPKNFRPGSPILPRIPSASLRRSNSLAPMGELPYRLIVYGIEGLDFPAGTELSPEVAEVVGPAAAVILQEIRQQSAASAVHS